MERARERQPPQPPPPPPFQLQVLNQLQLILQRQDQIGNILRAQGEQINAIQVQLQQNNGRFDVLDRHADFVHGMFRFVLPEPVPAPPMAEPQENPQVENVNGREQFDQQVPIGGNENPDVPVAREIPEIGDEARPARPQNIPRLIPRGRPHYRPRRGDARRDDRRRGRPY
ncbi:hypothetical protein GCK72_011535 [Caenorhabditis remanei]|uniref:Uncharacterized protein n=1 Tax=Caenorhabditis remanei TaxID=31234 RepID=A0A6A5H885_CAERE|nr:hypothetical protein GCK72_011535 [Caenorhabditis remanei]KAF1763269.1 hypothetical protein GCK72_011535 [Caenorhabditis remanei]